MRIRKQCFAFEIKCNLPGDNAGQDVCHIYNLIHFFLFRYVCKPQKKKKCCRFLFVSVRNSIVMLVGKQFKVTDARDYGNFNVKNYSDAKKNIGEPEIWLFKQRKNRNA